MALSRQVAVQAGCDLLAAGLGPAVEQLVGVVHLPGHLRREVDVDRTVVERDGDRVQLAGQLDGRQYDLVVHRVDSDAHDVATDGEVGDHAVTVDVGDLAQSRERLLERLKPGQERRLAVAQFGDLSLEVGLRHESHFWPLPWLPRSL